MKLRHFTLILTLFLVITISGCTQKMGTDETVDGGGCCIFSCTSESKENCEMHYGEGSWKSQSCSEIKECEKHCCIEFCTEMTKYECEEPYGFGGTWTEASSCEDRPECDMMCCEPFNTHETEKVCEQQGGKAKPLPCPGDRLEGTVTIGFSDTSSHTETGDTSSTGVTKDEHTYSNNFHRTITFDLKSKTIAENTYFFEGTYDYSFTGSKNSESILEAREKCGMTNKYSFDSSITRETYTYSGSCHGDVKSAVIIKREDGYEFSLPYESESDYSFEKTSTSTGTTCDGRGTETPIEPITYSKDTECSQAAVHISSPVLSGTHSYSQERQSFDTYYRSGVRPEEKTETVTITSTLKWVSES